MHVMVYGVHASMLLQCLVLDCCVLPPDTELISIAFMNATLPGSILECHNVHAWNGCGVKRFPQLQGWSMLASVSRSWILFCYLNTEMVFLLHLRMQHCLEVFFSLIQCSCLKWFLVQHSTRLKDDIYSQICNPVLLVWWLAALPPNLVTQGWQTLQSVCVA